MSEPNILCAVVIAVPDQIVADNVQISNTPVVEALSQETIDIDINNDSLLRSEPPPPPPPPYTIGVPAIVTNDLEANSSSDHRSNTCPKCSFVCNFCIYLTTFYCIIFVVLLVTLLILFL